MQERNKQVILNVVTEGEPAENPASLGEGMCEPRYDTICITKHPADSRTGD